MSNSPELVVIALITWTNNRARTCRYLLFVPREALWFLFYLKMLIKKRRRKRTSNIIANIGRNGSCFCFCFISFPWHPVYFHPILTVKFRFMIGLSTKSINSSKRDLLKRAEEMKKTYINSSSFQIESFVFKKNPNPLL